SEAVPCPKCGRAWRAGERACARCGLLAVRFGAFAAERRAVEPQAAALDVDWAGCRGAWGDARVHDRLLDKAARLELLPALARRYREVSEEAPDPVADKRLRQIAVLLEHALRAQAREAGSSRSMRALWAFGYLAAAAVLGSS